MIPTLGPLCPGLRYVSSEDLYANVIWIIDFDQIQNVEVFSTVTRYMVTRKVELEKIWKRGSKNYSSQIELTDYR